MYPFLLLFEENLMLVQNAYAAVPGGPATPAATANPLISFTPILGDCGILYFLVIRPQQKQAKDHKSLVDNIKSGDRALTQGRVDGHVRTLNGTVRVLKQDD